MSEPARKQHPEIEPDIRPDLRVVQGGGESTPGRGDLRAADNPALDLSDQERRFGVIQGGGETTSGRGNLSAVDSNKNIDAARQGEQAGGNAGGNWRTNTSEGGQPPVTPQDWIKKKSPMAFLLGITGGAGFIITMLFSPGVAIVHFKEVLFNDLNDQATAMDIRSVRIMTSQLQADTTAGLCTTKISVGCRLKRQGKPFIDRLKEAGAAVECSNGDCTNRWNNKPTKYTFPDGTVVDARNFRSVMLSNPEARSIMNRAYNPVFFSMWDATAGKWLGKMGINRAPKKPGKDNEDTKRRLREAGNIPAKDGQPLIPKYDKDDPSKVVGYTDSSGNEYSVEDALEIQAATESLEDTAGGAAKKVARGVVGTVGVIGAASTACEAIRTIETVSMGAKIIRTAESILAAEAVTNPADSIKATKGDPAITTPVGEMLTEPNTDEFALDDNGQKIPNPDLGKTATDAIGFQAAAGFLEGVPKLSSSDGIYSVGTPTTGVLDTLSRMARNVVDKESCGVILNPFVQAGSVVLGIAAAIFTGGLSTTQIVGQGIFSAVVSVGMAYAEAMLKDMAAGNISENFKNVGVGNISFVGVSEMLQRIGGGRGMGYQTTENMDSFNQLRVEFNERYVATQKFEAQKDPFNPMLQYSFAGILARQMLPLQNSSLTKKLTTVAALPLRSIQSILSPTASALDSKPYNRERFNVCEDDTYVEMGVKADIFCNLRRAMSAEELALDPVQVADWMIANDYVDDTVDTTAAEVDTIAKGDYKMFLDSCVNAADAPPGFGDDKWTDKTNCINPVDISKETLSYFRVFTMDYSIVQGMDNEPQSVGASSGDSTTPTGELVTGDAKELARKVANNSNIIFVKPATRTALENFANTGQAINSCGQPFAIDPMLTGVMLTLASKYKIYVGNFGFNTDRSFCDTGQHPKGRAIDINGIEQIGGGKTSWGTIRFTPSELPIITNYANDWLVALPPDRGGVGQKACLNGSYPRPGGFAITPPPDAVKVNGSLFFDDDCNHLHIDVRQR